MRNYDIDLHEIEIDDFIFHVVHHGEDEPILMDETPIIGYEQFFKERIREVYTGNRFKFGPTSSFLNKIASLDSGTGYFVPISKELAVDLHAHQKGNIKPGVMILMKTRLKGATRYLLIKYDHEPVISYRLQDRKAMLHEIANSFTKSKDALQKSAIVDLQASVPTVMIIDKSDPAHITQFFKGFLGIVRTFSNEELTDRVKICYLQTVAKFKEQLPSDYTGQASMTFYNVVKSTEKFEPEPFLKKVFGEHYRSDMDAFFHRQLSNSDISGEVFTFNKSIRKPKLKKYKTQEGVSIQYPENADNTVTITHLPDGTGSVVKITTSKLFEDA